MNKYPTGNVPVSILQSISILAPEPGSCVNVLMGHFDFRTFALRAVMRESEIANAKVRSCKGKQRKGEYATTKRKVAKKSAKLGR